MDYILLECDVHVQCYKCQCRIVVDRVEGFSPVARFCISTASTTPLTNNHETLIMCVCESLINSR